MKILSVLLFFVTVGRTTSFQLPPRVYGESRTIVSQLHLIKDEFPQDLNPYQTLRLDRGASADEIKVRRQSSIQNDAHAGLSPNPLTHRSLPLDTSLVCRKITEISQKNITLIQFISARCSPEAVLMLMM